MCAPSPPPPPDVIGQANAQGAANEQAARVQGHLNNPNIVGPQGSRDVTWTGDTATITNRLSPGEQAIYEQGVRNRSGLGGLAGQGIDSLRGVIGTELDLSGAPQGGAAFHNEVPLPRALDRASLPSAPNAYQGASNLPSMPSASETLRQRVIDAQLQRSNTAINQQSERTKSELIAAGIRPGTEAYAREMDALGRQRNDAQAQAEANATQAVQSAFGQDLARRQQGYNEGITDANTRFGQGMSLRTQAAGEQGQQFNQQGQNVQEAAALQAQNFGQSNEARRQAIAEILAGRQVPLNEITALMSGSQVAGSAAAGGGGGAPGFSGGNVAPAPVFAANQANQQYQQDVYNSQVATQNTNTQAGAAVAAAVIAAMF